MDAFILHKWLGPPGTRDPSEDSPFTLSSWLLPETPLPTLTWPSEGKCVCPARVTGLAVSGPGSGRMATGAGDPGEGGPEGVASGKGGQHPAVTGAACGHGSQAAAGHTAG